MSPTCDITPTVFSTSIDSNLSHTSDTISDSIPDNNFNIGGSSDDDLFSHNSRSPVSPPSNSTSETDSSDIPSLIEDNIDPDSSAVIKIYGIPGIRPSSLLHFTKDILPLVFRDHISDVKKIKSVGGFVYRMRISTHADEIISILRRAGRQ